MIAACRRKRGSLRVRCSEHCGAFMAASVPRLLLRLSHHLRDQFRQLRDGHLLHGLWQVDPWRWCERQLSLQGFPFSMSHRNLLFSVRPDYRESLQRDRVVPTGQPATAAEHLHVPFCRFWIGHPARDDVSMTVLIGDHQDRFATTRDDPALRLASRQADGNGRKS